MVIFHVIQATAAVREEVILYLLKSTFMKRAVYTTIIALLAAGAVACASNGQNTGNQTTGGSGNDGDSASSAVPVVYMIEETNPENLVRIYEALGREATGKVAVKISTGEPGGHNFLQPSLIKDLVQKVDGTIVECNTAYGGGRANTEAHRKAAEDHGFTAIADVDIMDSEGEVRLPVEGGSHIGYDIVGSHYLNYDFTIILSHFKGHAMAGFGGAIKNMSIGIASSNGKIHLIERIDSRNGMHTLDHAEAIGMGSQTYELVRLD